MEASGPSGKRSVSPKQGIVEIIGTAIAVITLTVPIITIAHFSRIQNRETILPPTYSLPRIENDLD
jgi:hypothetical protein